MVVAPAAASPLPHRPGVTDIPVSAQHRRRSAGLSLAHLIAWDRDLICFSGVWANLERDLKLLLWPRQVFNLDFPRETDGDCRSHVAVL